MALSVTAGGLTLTNNGGAPYDIHEDGLTFNGLSYTQKLIESPYLHGSVEVSRKKNMVPCGMKVDVFGDTATEAQTRLATLIDTLSAGDWTLTVVVNSVATYSWTCMAINDYKVGPWTRFIEENIIDIDMSFLRYPIPLSGGIG